MISLQWMLRTFDELTPAQLYSVLALRQQVFIIEQNCLFQDIDGKAVKIHVTNRFILVNA